MKKIELNEEQCYCGIQELYDNIFEVVTGEPATEEDFYEPSKVWVSKPIFEQVSKYYEEVKGWSDNSFTFSMNWVNVGPKAVDTLQGYEVEVEDGWTYKKGEDK